MVHYKGTMALCIGLNSDSKVRFEEPTALQGPDEATS